MLDWYKIFPLRDIANTDLLAIGDNAYSKDSSALSIIREPLACLRDMPFTNPLHTKLNNNARFANDVMQLRQWPQTKKIHEIVKLEATYSD